VLACLAAIAAAGAAARPAEPPPEVRALWVLRASLSSSSSIATLVRSARESGFNTLFVQVRGRGDAYFAGGLEPRAEDLASQPSDFDPLAEVLAAARAAGLRVHAWVNADLVASAADLPSARGHLVYRRPEWLMVPRALAQELAAVEPDSPAYVGRLARWTRTQSSEVEGLYVSPIPPAAAAYTVDVVADLAARYAVDGVHLDYIRYPTADFDYSRAALEEFRDDVAPQLDAAARRALDEQQTDDLFAYADAFPDRWAAFRRARLTALVASVRDAVKRVRPAAAVTAAVAPDRREAFDRRLQDWGAWIERGLIDAVCPMAYTPEPARFAEQIAAAREAAGPRPVWAGIGAYRLSPEQTVDHIQAARRLGAAGVVLFSYDSLVSSAQRRGHLSQIGRAAFPAAADTGSR
jgi:uncharacterized lipoprotein YddW (UPF0748 family)